MFMKKKSKIKGRSSAAHTTDWSRVWIRSFMNEQRFVSLYVVHSFSLTSSFFGIYYSFFKILYFKEGNF